MFQLSLFADAVPLAPAATSVAEFWKPVHDFSQAFHDWFAAQQGQLLLFLAGLAVTFLIAGIVSFVIRRFGDFLAAKTATDLDEVIIRGLHAPVLLLLLSSGVICSTALLQMSSGVAHLLRQIYYAVATLSFVWGLLRVIGVFDLRLRSRLNNTDGNLDTLLIDLLRRVAKSAIWIIAVLFIAQNIFNLNVGALLAGAGVAGLAVAFAAQNTIANIFGAVTLILDKPFGIGDRVQTGGVDGSVESVGLRSTGIRALDGTLHFIPNRQMADANIANLSRRPNLKWSFNVGLVYETPAEGMRQAVALLHEILDSNPNFDTANFPPRIYFTEMRDWSLNINVVVWFNTTDWFAMQSARQEINFAILERFNAAKLSFAYPTSTQHLVRDN